jgi:hypothetical protein
MRLKRVARARQLDIDHVAQLSLRVIRDADSGRVALNPHPFVIFTVVQIVWNVRHDAPLSKVTSAKNSDE